MQIVEYKKENVCVLELQGRLDVLSAPAFQEKCLSAVVRGERILLLDCIRLDYVSSAGVRALAEVAYQLGQVSGRIALCCVSEDIRDLLDLVELSAELLLFSSREEAFEKLSGPPAGAPQA